MQDDKIELAKAKKELKDYVYEKRWIEERLEDIKERKTLLENITNTLSDMPNRKQKNLWYSSRKFSQCFRFNKWIRKIFERIKRKTNINRK